MRLTVPEPDIPEVGGFTDSNDLFGYRDFAGRLANVVGNIDEPLVIVLDGPWGSGKSVFIKQWAGLLRKRGAPVIYFDAFQHDYYEDAFLALSAEIYATAEKELRRDESTAKRFLDTATKMGAVLVPAVARASVRAVTASLLNWDDISKGGAALEAAVKAVGEESEKAIEERLRKAGDERAAMEAFRQALSELAVKLGNDKSQDETYPLVFIVDELDRCRPPFALGIVERIKHLFSVPGVCFVLVTNLQQLGTSVQGAYGTAFDAHTYLEKFYQLRVVLSERTRYGPTQTDAYIDHLWRVLGIEFSKEEGHKVVEGEIKALAKVYDLSLRRLERVMTHISLVCASARPRQLVIPILVAGLCVMRQTHPELYDKARKETLTWGEVRKFFQPMEGLGIRDEWISDWWKFAIGEDMSEEKLDWHTQRLWHHHVRKKNRTILLPMMTGYIDELVQRPPDEGR